MRLPIGPEGGFEFVCSLNSKAQLAVIVLAKSSICLRSRRQDYKLQQADMDQLDSQYRAYLCV